MRRVGRLGRAWAVLLLALALSGCVWLRLLETKNQLADFEHNFRVENTGGHFVLHFLHPALFSDDFLYLSKLRPTRVEPQPKGYRWVTDFVLESAAGKTLTFSMSFDAEQHLVAWDFSPLFVQMMPPPFLEASLRSLGKGKVDQGRNQLKVDPADLPRLRERPPTRRHILEVMGPPALQFPKENMQVYLYRFLAQATPLEPEYEKRRQAEAKLYFDAKSGELVRMSSKFAGLKLAIDYRNLTGVQQASTE